MMRTNSTFAGTDGIECENHLAPYSHVANLPSKNIRKKFADSINDRWLHLPQPLVEGVVEVIDILHNSSLLIDDIEDNSVLRRGAPAAHKLFGMGLTINCANQMYFEAMQKAMALPLCLEKKEAGEKASESEESMMNEENRRVYAECKEYLAKHQSAVQLKLMEIFTAEMVELHEGQGKDIMWRDTLTCPTIGEYKLMVLQKTGGLFRLALRLLMTLHPTLNELPQSPNHPTPNVTNPSLVLLVNNIGVLFQMLDDYLNVVSSRYHKNKTFFEDLTEGKFSFPIIHSIRTAGLMPLESDDPAVEEALTMRTNSSIMGSPATRTPLTAPENASFTSQHRSIPAPATTGAASQPKPKPDRRLFHILRQRTDDVELKKFCVQLMEETDTFRFCEEALRNERHAIELQIVGLGGCKHLSGILDEMMNMMKEQ